VSESQPGNRQAAERNVDEIRLLTLQEMHTLFPDATIQQEKFGPFLKSITAIGQGFP